jgi:HSP20 family molecular chaperone IbpA
MNKLMRRLDPFDSIPSLIPSYFMRDVEEIFKSLDVYNPVDKTWRMSKGFPQGGVVIEDDRAVIELALAGYNKDQLSISIDNDKILVSAEKCEDTDERRCRTLAQRAFKQEFLFNKTFDLGKSEATFEDGLLQITVPKKLPDPSLSKEIKIK